MELTVSLVMQSHLSDAMIEMDFNPEQANHRLRFSIRENTMRRC